MIPRLVPLYTGLQSSGTGTFNYLKDPHHDDTQEVYMIRTLY